MSTEIHNPVVPTEAAAPVAPVVPTEPIPAATPLESEPKPLETVEPTTEATPALDGEAVAPVEETKEEKPVEPIYSGALGYKAPGLKNFFRFSKKYFWFGEETAVPTSSLSQYLRGEKAEIAHPTAAWSSVTGKGLLFFVKHADQKESPAGVLSLADAADLSKDGTVEFHFKLHGDKHTFQAQNVAERNGWFVAVEKAIEEAKVAKEGIVSSEAYKEEKKKLGTPTTLAPTAAATPKKSTEVVPEKSTEVAPAAAEGEVAATPAGEAVVPARTGSSSSSDEEKKKKAAKSKSRSASRGKRASLFGNILGKKEKAEEKKEEKKEEKAEEKVTEEEATPAVDESSTAVAPVSTAPVITDLPKPVEEAEDTAVVAPVAEEKKVEEKPKPTKRTSMFGSFVEKLKSPTHEKKEPEFTPLAKEPEVSAEAPKLEETPKVEDAPLAPVTDVVDGTSEVPKKSVEVKPTATGTTPIKEKQHFKFGKFLGGGKEKVKSPTTEEAPKLEETPAPIAPVEPIEPALPIVPAAEPSTEAAKEESVAEVPTTTPAAKKRGSIFGNLGGGSVKKEKDGEEKPQGFKGLFRNASKAGKPSKKEKETTTTPAKVEEAVEPTDAAPATEAKAEETPALAAPTELASIGDVNADAVSVGQAPKSTPAVTSSA